MQLLSEAESMRKIPADEITFHPHSFADPAGRLFHWRGELYRGINCDNEPFFRRLFERGVINHLVAQGLLIDSKLTPLVLDGYSMVIQHRVLPFCSYPNEWAPLMFKDAVLALIALAKALANYGLTLKDHNQWNLMFDKIKPIYVDLTSITTQQDGRSWTDYEKFSASYLRPLLLMARGHDRIARLLLTEDDGVRATEADEFGVKLRRVARRYKRNKSISLDALEHMVETIDLAVASATALPRVDDSVATGLLKTLRPRSVADLGFNGWFSSLAAQHGTNSLFLNPDAARVTDVYCAARREALPILPLVIDFIKPTPSMGVASHASMAAVDRLKCELVFAEAIEQIRVTRYLRPEQIVGALAAFSSRWVLVRTADAELQDALAERFRAMHRISFDYWLCDK
jgi:hypothetical protein